MANPSLPTVNRQVTAESHQIPDFQGAFEQNAASQGLGALGASVAQSANNTMAAQLGYEQGKEPVGDLMPPLTNFDKHFQDSYHAQAQTTLSLQGQKLLDDAEIEMSKPSRLNPGLIAKTTEQLKLGLSKISANAPTAIKGSLEGTFASQIMNQEKQYNKKMISEQRSDTADNYTNVLDLNAKKANELAANGDIHGAEKLVEANNGIANAAYNGRYISPEAARVAQESVKQAKLNGEYSYIAQQYEQEGKYDEFKNNYSRNKPTNMTNEEWLKTGQAVNSQMEFLRGLRSEHQNLLSQQMLNAIASGQPISGLAWQQYEDNVEPLTAEKMKFKLIQANNKKSSSNEQTNAVIRDFSDAGAMANYSPEAINSAFGKQVDGAIQNSHQTNIPLRSPSPLSRDQAEVQVAASAGVAVPVFTKSLKNKLWSGDPAQMDSASRQIHDLKELHAGHALTGLNDQDNALFSQYESLRNPADPTVGAKLAIETSQNLDEPVLKVTQQKWAKVVDDSTRKADVDVGDWILGKFFNQHNLLSANKEFDSPYASTYYAADILGRYKAYYENTRGNQKVAEQMTQEYVDASYGKTSINGDSQWTKYPIEKALGFESNDGVPFIQNDVVEQLSPAMNKLKAEYDNKMSNEYWEIQAPEQEDNRFRGPDKGSKPLRLIKHTRAQVGTTTQAYDMALISNNFGEYDVNIQTNYGPQNLFLNAPMLGVMSYKPNKEKITSAYTKAKGL